MMRIAPTTRAPIVSVTMGTLLVGLVLFGTGCPPPPPACSTDADCDNGLFCDGAETCVDAVCVDGTSPCAEGETCDEENDICVAPPCESDEDCAEDEVCNLDTGECEPAPAGCTSNDDCAEGEFCDVVTGDCIPNDNLYETVTFDHDTHMGTFACTMCHHDGAGFSTCDTCHNRDEVVGGIPVLKDVSHDPAGGCWQCHNEQNDDGTRDCSVCHTALPD